MKSMVVMSLVMMQGLKNSVEQLIDKLIFWKKILYEIWIFHGKWKFFKLTKCEKCSVFGVSLVRIFSIRTEYWPEKFFAFFFEHFSRSVIKEKQSHNY